MKSPTASAVLKERKHPMERRAVKRVSFDMLREAPGQWLIEPVKLAPAQEQELESYRRAHVARTKAD